MLDGVEAELFKLADDRSKREIPRRSSKHFETSIHQSVKCDLNKAFFTPLYFDIKYLMHFGRKR